MLRLFASIPISFHLSERLAGLQTGLPGRLTRFENFHVTLAFFGEIAETQAEDLDDALAEIDAPGFDILLEGAGAFGGDKPRLLYAAVRPDPALLSLAAKVRQAARLARLKISAERYTPHVTLTRLSAQAMRAEEAAQALGARAGFLAGPMAVNSFGLHRSDLSRHGPTYTELRTYALRAAEADAGSR